MASIIYYIFLLIFTLVYFVPLTLLFFVTVLFDRERKILHYASKMWAIVILKSCPAWSVNVSGTEKIDRKKAYVMVTNHQAMLDIPLMYLIPLNFKWVSKKEVLRMPLFGWVLRMHGDIAIERGSTSSAKKMMNKALEILARGTSVVLFPEGTRSKDGNIGRFKEGAFVMAKNAGVDILPIVAEGTGSLMDGWRMRMPHKFTIKVLEPIPCSEVTTTDAKALAEKVCSLMRDEHKKLF